MDKTSSPDAPVEAKARFWVGPLVAGCCFALGYGITERVLTLQPNAEDPVPEAFTPLSFPGDSLQKIRAQFSDDDSSLQVDVTALEAAEAASRPAQPAVKETPKPAVALQTPEPPVWTAPAWSDPQTIVPELDDSNADSLALPEDSIDVMPAVVVPDGDSPVLVAEPESVVLPPGAEAFFEVIEPVTPPQPRSPVGSATVEAVCIRSMGSSEALIRATVNRISARLGHGVADAAAEFAVLAQDAPQRLRQEWDLFQDEVRAEAERIERGDQVTVSTDGASASEPSDNPQAVIDRLRATVADLSQAIEARP